MIFCDEVLHSTEALVTEIESSIRKIAAMFADSFLLKCIELYPIFLHCPAKAASIAGLLVLDKGC